jgi:hypothetical protein
MDSPDSPDEEKEELTEEESEEECETPPVKKPRSEAQMAVLARARQKAYEIRKQRAAERQVKEDGEKIDKKLSDAEKDKEILKLKKAALELKLNAEIKKPPKRQVKPKQLVTQIDATAVATGTEAVEPTPTLPTHPAPQKKKAFTRDSRGNLLFHE